MYNYPNKKKITTHINETSKQNTSLVGHLRRGMDLEELINQSNSFYVSNDIAFIYKKPTPIKVNKISHNNQFGTRTHKITDAYFSEKSTTDYNGLYKGLYIDFEAKQTKYKSFNVVSNLHEHQRSHLKNVMRHGGLAFLFVYFYQYDKIYIIDYKYIDEFIQSGKSQIPLEFFEQFGYELKLGFNPALDYLKYIDSIIEKR
ncbi:Holliday junction resolvase RecU [Mollicutes bacterium LVI A0078]|nr:Holliday junction resolvase RecU [Mollicutes bacterium LVI A0075]WOO90634.1 Holliday junction resolvase RecU [Mollicutes bacterium LVI A0078]